MIVSTMRVVTSRQNRAQVLQALRALAGPVAVRSGCTACRLSYDVQDTRVVTWIEEWDSRAAMDAHIRSADYRTILAVMEMSVTPPLLRFDIVHESAGLELVESVRRRPDEAAGS